MTVKELINALNQIQNQDAEIILEDAALGLAVKLDGVNDISTWQDGAIDLWGDEVPNSHWDDEEEDEDE